MRKTSRQIAHAALIAAMYVALTYLQNLLIPGSGTWAIQFRVSEALCVLAFFSPAAIWGLAVGCFLFNLTFAGALPLDMVLGSLATLLAAGGMYLTRRVRLGSVPLLGLLLPAVANGIVVGWELAVTVGGGFWVNAGYIAAGEMAVLLTLGWALWAAMEKNNLAGRLFAGR